MNRTHDSDHQLRRISAAGAWPFVTHIVYQKPDNSRVEWHSRRHRKGLGVDFADAKRGLESKWLAWAWMPRQLNWWIGVIFALGSSLFVLGSILSLTPSLAGRWSLSPTEINAFFFAGSIPFTTAAYLQLLQAANAGPFPRLESETPQRIKLLGWLPQDIGWLSSALQFLGTLLFNINTFDAMCPSLDWFLQDLMIWVPDIVGSTLFLLSGYLAFIETCHAHWAWQPKSISWWVVFANLLGCVGFMISALLAIVMPGSPHVEAEQLSLLFTLLGAVGFLVGSLLMLPEITSTAKSSAKLDHAN